MARKIAIKYAGQQIHMLDETRPDNEEALRTLVQDNPDLIPTEELGVDGSLMIVGRETSLPSGAVDLVAIAMDGDIFLIEFKIGTQNPDFRRALAQLLDYGAHLWGKTYGEFEETIALRYFSSPECRDERLKQCISIEAAFNRYWPDREEYKDSFKEKLASQLSEGSFRYIVIASNFSQVVETTINYLNAIMPRSRFYGIELLPFTGNELTAYEARTVIRPESRPKSLTQKSFLNESSFLEQVTEARYQLCLKGFFNFCAGQGIVFSWGTVGASMRSRTLEKNRLLSVGWIFPPGRIGWMGLSNLTLGIDLSSLKSLPLAKPAVSTYMDKIAALPSATPIRVKNCTGVTFQPAEFMMAQRRIEEILAELIQGINSIPEDE